MKKKVYSIILILIMMIFLYQTSVKAVIVSTDKQVESGSGTVTISVTSNKSLGAYKLTLTDLDGLTLVSAAGGEVSADKKVITGSSAEGTTKLGTYTFNVPTVDKDTTYNIKFSITGMETPNLDEIPDENNVAKITVKAPAKETPTPTPTSTPEPKKLEFTPKNNITVYLTKTTNFRSACNTKGDNVIKTLEAGTELTQIGVSKTKAEGYTWSKVTYKGQTGYVINDNLTTTKPAEQNPQPEAPTQEEPKTEEPEEPADEAIPINEDGSIDITNGLKNLQIAGLTLDPVFRPNVYEYRVIVEKDISSLDITAESIAEGATVSIAGNENLKEGENLITITVYNDQNEVATYQITTFKNTLDLTKTDKVLIAGNKAATRGMIIFTIILAVSIIALIVVLILKRRNEYEEDDDEEDEDYDFGAYPNTPMQGNASDYFAQNINQTMDSEENIDSTYNTDNTYNEEEPMQTNRSIMQEDFMRDDFMQEDGKQHNYAENDILENDTIDEEEQPKRDKKKGKHF